MRPQPTYAGDTPSIKQVLVNFKNSITNAPMNFARWFAQPISGVFDTILLSIFNDVAGSVADLPHGLSYQSLPAGAIVMPKGNWYLSGGLVGSLNSWSASLLSAPPASGVYYAYNIWHKLTGPAYAAGVAFNPNSDMGAIMNIWKVFRDFTYALFALIFLVAGLMIMLRVRVSSQAVMSLSNALPRLVGALVLVTFSYAIAGFMIDLMYLLIGVIMVLLKANNLLPSFPVVGAVSFLNHGSPILAPTPQSMMGGSMLNLAPSFVLGYQAAAEMGAIMGAVLSPILMIGGGVAGASIIGGGAIIALIVWSFVMLYLGFKIFFALIKTYISIIVLIIFAPFQILGGVLPGGNGGFSSWFKSLTADLLVFPILVLVLMLGGYLATKESSLWYPPFLGTPVLGDMGGLGSYVAGHVASAAIALGTLMMIPAIPKQLKRMLGVEGGLFADMTGGLVAGLIAATGPIRKPFQVMQAGVEREMANNFGTNFSQLASHGWKISSASSGGSESKKMGVKDIAKWMFTRHGS